MMGLSLPAARSSIRTTRTSHTASTNILSHATEEQTSSSFMRSKMPGLSTPASQSIDPSHTHNPPGSSAIFHPQHIKHTLCAGPVFSPLRQADSEPNIGHVKYFLFSLSLFLHSYSLTSLSYSLFLLPSSCSILLGAVE